MKMKHIALLLVSFTFPSIAMNNHTSGMNFLKNVPNTAALLAHYQPTFDRARATVRCENAPKAPRYDHTAGLALACVIENYKPLFWGEESALPFKTNSKQWVTENPSAWIIDQSNNIQPNGLQHIFKENNITILSHRNDTPHTFNVIFYRDKQRTNALLYLKAEKEKKRDAYLLGHLLGYQDEDIHAYYKSINSDKFEKARTNAHTWLANNRPTIEEWAAQDPDISRLPSEIRARENRMHNNGKNPVPKNYVAQAQKNEPQHRSVQYTWAKRIALGVATAAATYGIYRWFKKQ